MCGIAGVLAPRPRPDLRAPLDTALERLRHRGPDDAGTLEVATGEAAPWAAIGNRRLAILEPTPAGHQPMATADGRWALVLNGEIYNHVEVREALAREGHAVRSRSDTATFLAAWAAWGPDALARCIGMYAACVVDRDARRAWLMRDHVGIKPLVYAAAGDALVFASEPAALLAFPGPGRRADAAAVRAFLAEGHSDFGAGTLLADVRAVPAGHCLEVALDRPLAAVARRHWTLPLDREERWSPAEAAAQVRTAFLDSMRLHLRSDVPLGFALSSGVDSTAIIGAARHLLGPAAELHAFTFASDEPAIDESARAALAARHAGAQVHEVRIAPAEVAADLPALVRAQGAPFTSPVVYAQARIYRAAAARGMKVLLGGQGADEVLAGYDRYVVLRAAGCLRRGEFLVARRLLGQPLSVSAASAWRGALGRALPSRLQAALRHARRPAMPWLNEGWFAARGAQAPAPWVARGPRRLRAMLAHNLLHSQVEALLRYEDRNAMAASVENRVPFLTPAFLELAFRLPESCLIAPDGRRKAVFRDAMRGLVPDAILDDRTKRGFSIPSARWFATLAPWVADRLVRAAELPCLSPRLVRLARAAVLAGVPAADPLLLWRWITFAEWVDQVGVTFD